MTGSPSPVREVVADLARRAASAPPSPTDPVASVCALLTLDPRNRAHIVANVAAIVTDALTNGDRETYANRWRRLRPPWVRPSTVGATVNRLTALGVLVPTGRYVHCTDSGARNRGKLQPVYTLDLTAVSGAADPLGRTAPEGT